MVIHTGTDSKPQPYQKNLSSIKEDIQDMLTVNPRLSHSSITASNLKTTGPEPGPGSVEPVVSQTA